MSGSRDRLSPTLAPCSQASAPGGRGRAAAGGGGGAGEGGATQPLRQARAFLLALPHAVAEQNRGERLQQGGRAAVGEQGGRRHARAASARSVRAVSWAAQARPASAGSPSGGGMGGS